VNQSDIQSIAEAINTAINAQSQARSRREAGTKQVATAFMLISVAILSFIGMTVWTNSIKIEGLMVGLKTVNDKIETTMADRFTGMEGRGMDQRLTTVENVLVTLAKDEHSSHALLDKHIEVSEMRQKNLSTRVEKLESKK
jgi:hypothetical protein